MNAEEIIELNHSGGEVSFDGPIVNWQGFGATKIHLEQVAVIGEHVTENDWLLVFVLKNGKRAELSVYAEGYQALTEHLGEYFKVDFSKVYLANNVQRKSFVRFPQHIEGKDLFEITPPEGYKEPQRFREKLKAIFGVGVYGTEWKTCLSEDVKEVLKNSTDQP